MQNYAFAYLHEGGRIYWDERFYDKWLHDGNLELHEHGSLLEGGGKAESQSPAGMLILHITLQHLYKICLLC